MKKILIGTLVALLLVGLGAFKYYQDKNPEVFNAFEKPTVSPTEGIGGVTAASSSTKTTINVLTDVPVGGTYKGVIEVGASGFNSFVVNIDKEKNWELVSKEFGESLAYEGFATTDDVKLGLKKYLGNMFNKGVAGRNAHFVISSGALKNPKTELIAKAIEQMGYVVNRVTPEQEGQYALRALLPKAYKTNSFTVDMGSGNTKVSWYEGSKLKSLEGPGAKFYQDEKANENNVRTALSNILSQVPSSNKQNCFIIGGIPFKLASSLRKGEERFTLLEQPDFYNAGDDIKLKSGLVLYQEIVKGAPNAPMLFDWDANFTIGFLMSLN